MSAAEPDSRGGSGSVEQPAPTQEAAPDYPPPHPLDDPAALKALAHPVRLQLLTTLGMYGAQNVKALAALVGEPANSVSYHLSQLAAHGLIVPASPPEGTSRRERWWENASPSGFSFNSADMPEAAGQAAVRAWMVQLATDAIDRAMASEGRAKGLDLPSGNATIGAWLTRDEAREGVELLNQVLSYMADRFFAQRGQGVLVNGPDDGQERFYYRMEALMFADLTGAPTSPASWGQAPDAAG